MRREQSYAAIRIERLDRTVLINNSYGEATYVVTWILDIEDLITFTKKDYQEDQNAVRVKFFSSNPGLWGEQISKALFSLINKKLKNDIKKQEEAELEREAISNEKKREEITKFFLKNYGTKIKITKEHEKDYTFPEEESKGLNIFTGKKNEQLYIFTEGEERNVYTFTDEDKEKLIMMHQKERSELRIIVWGEPQSLDTIATTYWLKGRPNKDPKSREKLLSIIIWEEIKSKKEIIEALNEEIKKKTIQYFNEHYATKMIENWKVIYVFTEENKEKLIMMTKEERRNLKITVWGESQGLWATARAFWLKEGNPTNNQEDRIKLLSEIIWEKIKSKKEIIDALNEEIKKETIKYFNDHYATKMIENWKVIYVFTEEDKEKLVMMRAEERTKIKITVWGKHQGLQSIATAFWFKGEPHNSQKDREKLLSEIIKGGMKSRKELIKKYFQKDFSTTKEAKEKLATMEREKDKYRIAIQGRAVRLKGMAEAFWVKGNPVNDLEVLEKLIDTIWKYEPPTAQIPIK